MRALWVCAALAMVASPAAALERYSLGEAATLEALEALRESIANSPLVLRGDNRPQKKPKTPSPQKGPRKSVSVTISIGVAGPGAKQTPEQVLKEADKALYRAKKKGRNCVCS